MDISRYLTETMALLEQTRGEGLDRNVDAAIGRIATALKARLPLLVCGNGGSASDALHITGELVGRFLKDRQALKAIALSANPAVLTAWSNDQSFDTVFARQVEALGEAGGVLLGISTSGNSENVVEAFKTARELDMATIALTGAGGGRLAPLSDILLEVPSKATPRIQEAHVCIYHFMCQRVEEICARQ